MMDCKLFIVAIWALAALSGAAHGSPEELLHKLYDMRNSKTDNAKTQEYLEELFAMPRAGMGEEELKAIEGLRYLEDVNHYSLAKCYDLDAYKKLRSKTARLIMNNYYTQADYLMAHLKGQLDYCAEHLGEMLERVRRFSNVADIDFLMEPIKLSSSGDADADEDQQLIDAVAAYLVKVAPLKKKSGFNVMGKMREREKLAAAFDREIVDGICRPLVAQLVPIHELEKCLKQYEVACKLDAAAQKWLEREIHCKDLVANSKLLKEATFKKIMKDLNKKEEIVDAEGDQ